MKKIIFIFVLISGLAVSGFAQDDVKPLVIGNFKFQFYIDTYYSYDLEYQEDSLINLRPFSSNCGYNNEFRLNIAALYINYNSEDIRGVFATQYGDVPFLTTPVEKQYIKFVKLANFGYRIEKNTWVDVGYMSNPIGYESSIPNKNIISTVSTMGYYEPGNLIGISLSHKFSDKLSATAMFYNSWNIASANNDNKSTALVLNYNPERNIGISLASAFGNESAFGKKDQWQIYNNLILTYSTRKIDLVGQLDAATQSNSTGTYSNQYGYMCAGMVLARYKFNRHFSLSGRADFFNDPDGIISQGDAGTDNRLHTYALTGGFEYSPFSNAYFRMEYSYLNADQIVFQAQNHKRTNITFTTGIKL